CGKVFTRRFNLQSHELVHSDLRPFSCDICTATFRRKFDLRRHMRSLHNQGDKPYTCDLCGLGFTRSDTLRRHRELEAVRGREAMQSAATRRGGSPDLPPSEHGSSGDSERDGTGSEASVGDPNMFYGAHMSMDRALGSVGTHVHPGGVRNVASADTILLRGKHQRYDQRPYPDAHVGSAYQQHLDQNLQLQWMQAQSSQTQQQQQQPSQRQQPQFQPQPHQQLQQQQRQQQPYRFPPEPQPPSQFSSVPQQYVPSPPFQQPFQQQQQLQTPHQQPAQYYQPSHSSPAQQHQHQHQQPLPQQPTHSHTFPGNPYPTYSTTSLPRYLTPNPLQQQQSSHRPTSPATIPLFEHAHAAPRIASPSFAMLPSTPGGYIGSSSASSGSGPSAFVPFSPQQQQVVTASPYPHQHQHHQQPDLISPTAVAPNVLPGITALLSQNSAVVQQQVQPVLSQQQFPQVQHQQQQQQQQQQPQPIPTPSVQQGPKFPGGPDLAQYHLAAGFLPQQQQHQQQQYQPIQQPQQQRQHSREWPTAMAAEGGDVASASVSMNMSPLVKTEMMGQPQQPSPQRGWNPNVDQTNNGFGRQ
ncbi:hypothetical protein HKX48_000651, partial [Thoreauomyces humboldtii]